MAKLLFFLLNILCLTCAAQEEALILTERNIAFTEQAELNYMVHFKKGEVYVIKVYQELVDIELCLYDAANGKISSTDLADGQKGTDRLEYAPTSTGNYRINIRSVLAKPVPDGLVSVDIERLSRTEIKRRKDIAKGLEAENAKEVSTRDIRHFWAAFDALASAKTYRESVGIIQRKYLDSATNGLKDS